MKKHTFLVKPSVTDRKLSFGKISLNEDVKSAQICSVSCSTLCVCSCTDTCAGGRCTGIIDNIRKEIVLSSN